VTILWDPYQGLWNRALLEAVGARLSGIPGKAVIRGIIGLDTTILAGRSLARRVSRLGLGALSRGAWVPAHVPIVYLDLGTHREARELRYMVQTVLPSLGGSVRTFGFEAIRDFYEEARQRFADRPDVRLVHAAVCYQAGTITLYRGQDDGLGASIYREGVGAVEEAPAVRLSDWLRDQGIDLQRTICLLRMNIEGAEYDVIRDLVDSGLVGSIDGYFGMMDDASKIDPKRGDRFGDLLRAHAISPFTFNSRDLKRGVRRRLIRYEIGTAVLAGLSRLGV
jgi:FkbM family methyltransferase